LHGNPIFFNKTFDWLKKLGINEKISIYFLIKLNKGNKPIREWSGLNYRTEPVPQFCWFAALNIYKLTSTQLTEI